MWVKICANTNLADAQLAAKLGADAIGFVFAPSKRQVTPDQVAAITPQLPKDLLKIGVFGAVSKHDILHATEVAGLTGVQLHRPYDPELVAALHSANPAVSLVQVVSIQVSANPSSDPDSPLERTLNTALSDARLTGVLLDAAQGSQSGGLGKAFDWNAALPSLRRAIEAAKAAHQSAGTTMPKLLLAGGLRPENVAHAIQLLHPDGVDVASGVEGTPGRKDPARMAAFISAARAALPNGEH